jgi:hypothetical protein
MMLVPPILTVIVPLVFVKVRLSSGMWLSPIDSELSSVSTKFGRTSLALFDSSGF